MESTGNHVVIGVDRIPGDPELLLISSCIQFNGEWSGSILGVPSDVVGQITTENVTTLMRMYRLLKVVHDQKGPETTIRSLLTDLEGAFDTLIINKDKSLNSIFVEDGTNEPGRTLSGRYKLKSYIPPKEACKYDGRLIELHPRDIEELRINNTKLLGEGSFGKVYESKKKSEGFGMHVVVKKIPFKKDANQDRSIEREMMASRIMHPFILPLFAVVDRRKEDPSEVWFVSPLYSNGDLKKVIKDKDKEKYDKLNQAMRVKILLHIAMAIQYIHNKVEGVREVILHKDISSKNVVLDDNYNARLIDFGLAREKDDLTSMAGGTGFYCHPDKGHGVNAKESWDYYAYGVIMRELLTSLGPDGVDNKYLKNMKEEDVQIDTKVWKRRNGEDLGEDLKEMSVELLDKEREWTVEEFGTKIVGRLKDIWDRTNKDVLELSEDDDKCHICMINVKAEETSMSQRHSPNCNQKIKTCIACEKNSFLNPITCYCGKKLSPEIGNGWGALLVAGKDTDNKRRIKSMAKDVKEIENLITSKAPRIIGIRKENIRIVISDSTRNEDRENDKGEEKEEQLWPRVTDHITYFSRRKDIHTLLVYFSCHGAKSDETGDAAKSGGCGEGEKSGDIQESPKNCFHLGSGTDSISLQDFEKELERLENITKLIIILDRCFPPVVRFINTERKYVQINSCESTQQANMTDDSSTFSKYFIRALKAKSEDSICPENCQYCSKYWQSTGSFITVSNLFSYLNGHLQASSQTPYKSEHLVDEKFAFYTDEEVCIGFKEGKDGDSEPKEIPIGYLRDMKNLKEKLIQEFKKENVGVGNVNIERQTYRKDKPYEACDTLEKVMHAWVHRQPLIVTFNSN